MIEPFDTMKDLSNVVREEAVSCDEGYKHINAGISLAIETVAPHLWCLFMFRSGIHLLRTQVLLRFEAWADS